MEIKLHPKKIASLLITTVVVIVGAHVCFLILRYQGHPHVFGLAQFFDIWKEYNIPNYYSSVTLFFCSIVLFTIADAHRRFRDKREFYFWAGMAAVFLWLSFDEIIPIHDRLVHPVRNLLNTSGIFYLAWIIPYGIAMVFIGLIYIKFLLRLPKKTRLLFFTAAFIYISGAFGLEMIEGMVFERSGDQRNLTMDILDTLEETMEMVGVVIFIYALLSYIADNLPDFKITISNN